MSKKTVALDLDGVIYDYDGWKGKTSFENGPIEGSFNFIRELIDNDFDVCIYTCRLELSNVLNSENGAVVSALEKWFEAHGLENSYLSKIRFSISKPPAILYIDDRGFNFAGTFPSIEFIKNFKPWNHK